MTEELEATLSMLSADQVAVTYELNSEVARALQKIPEIAALLKLVASDLLTYRGEGARQGGARIPSLTLRAKLSLLLSRHNEYLAQVTPDMIADENRHRAKLNCCIQELRARISLQLAQESLPADFLKQHFGLLDKLDCLEPKKLNSSIRLVYGDKTRKVKLDSWIAGGKVRQASLDRIIQRTQYIRGIHARGGLWFKQLAQLPELTFEDLCVEDDVAATLDPDAVYRFGAKLGIVFKQRDAAGVPHFSPCRTPADRQLMAYDLEPDRMRIVESIDAHLFSPPRPEFAQFLTQSRAECLLEDHVKGLKGVYALYYCCRRNDGRLIFYRATLRIGYALEIDPARGIQVIRCKLNMPCVRDKEASAELSAGRLAEDSGIDRYQYRGQLTPILNDTYVLIDLHLQPETMEARIQPMQGEALQADAVRIIAKLPLGRGQGSEALLLSISQRSPTDCEENRLERFPYASKAVMMRQQWHGQRHERERAEWAFMRQQPRYYHTLEAMHADPWQGNEAALVATRFSELFGASQTDFDHIRYALQTGRQRQAALTALERLERKFGADCGPVLTLREK